MLVEFENGPRCAVVAHRLRKLGKENTRED
jgi:hypothetical protein